MCNCCTDVLVMLEACGIDADSEMLNWAHGGVGKVGLATLSPPTSFVIMLERVRHAGHQPQRSEKVIMRLERAVSGDRAYGLMSPPHGPHWAGDTRLCV